MSKGEPIAIQYVHLVREGPHAVVYVEFPDGIRVKAISEFMDSPFSHEITVHGLRDLHQKNSPPRATVTPG